MALTRHYTENSLTALAKLELLKAILRTAGFATVIFCMPVARAPRAGAKNQCTQAPMLTSEERKITLFDLAI